jgi:cytochrome c
MRVSRSYSSFAGLCTLAGMALVMAAATSATGAQAQATRSTKDRVYTEAQADRGKQVFNEKCIDCHTAGMWGNDWNTKTAADVYDFVFQNMPEQAPGSLTGQQVVDILAFFMKGAELPAGQTELPTAIPSLKEIRMELP